MDNQQRRDQVFLRIVRNLSILSHCVSHQVACLYVKRGRILISGINGTPEGYTNCDELFGTPGSFSREAHHSWSLKHEIHAEMNGILFAARYGISLEGSTLYSTLQPCTDCIKNIIPSGIVRVVFADIYDKGDALLEIKEFYTGFGIPLEHVPLI